MDTHDLWTNEIETNDHMDLITDIPYKQYNHGNSGGESSNMRNSLLPRTSNRRTTMVLRTVDHSQPPVENPNNSPEVNAQLRKEYERVQQLNHTIETITQDFELATENIKIFNDHLDETDHLLDLWVQILSQTLQTKELFEAPLAKLVPPEDPVPLQTEQPLPPPPPSTTTTTTTTATAAAAAAAAATKTPPPPPPPTMTTATATTGTSFTRAKKVPVGTYMTKRPKNSNHIRRML